MNVRTLVEDGERLVALFAEWLTERRAQAPSRPFSLAVPGGSVAERFLPALPGALAEAGDLHVFWVDERDVPADDGASNYGLAKRVWLDRALVPPTAIHPLVPTGRSLAEVVRQKQGELVRVLGTPPRLDVALLGVGEDGHVASLFPGHRALHETAWLTFVDDAPKPPPRRMTLTLATLFEARAVAVGAFGRSKARVIARALSGEESDLPLARVVRHSRTCVLFLDHDAASELDE